MNEKFQVQTQVKPNYREGLIKTFKYLNMKTKHVKKFSLKIVHLIESL